MRTGECEAGAGMIKDGVRPRRGVMARIASLREVRAHVIGIRCALIIRQVASHAGRAVQTVIVIHVAIGASPRRDRVQAREREPCAGVVERRIHPVRGVVTRIAGLREIRCHVIRIGGALEIL